ncbi:MAG: helix-hairpin-helix domain-containing protein, partial [Ignavibacteriaceae bacterium]
MINRKSILIIITILFLIPVKIIFSQTDSSYIEAEDVLDDILQEPSEETDNSDLYESIEYLLNHPINLNTAKISDLQQIPELDLESARLIISYKEKYGYFFSVKELNAVQGLDKDLIEGISPFLKVIKNEKQKAQTIKNESTFDEIL